MIEFCTMCGAASHASETTDTGVCDACLFLERCYFCDHTHGSCTCAFPSVDDIGDLDVAVRDGVAFDTGSEIVSQPNVSFCGRFYVNPVAYWGHPYEVWAKMRGLKPYK